MIRGITITNHNNESLELDLFHPEWSGIIVNSIKGLGPPKANINYTQLAAIDGGVFTSARTDVRNIVIELTMMWDVLIEDSRLKIYKYFPIKKPISIEILTDRRHAIAYGYVESNEPDIFSSNESTQISILCPDPFFYELEQSIQVFSGIEPTFEFPFMNDSLTENRIQFGNILEDNRGIINYKGDVDTGVLITCTALYGPVENPSIWNVKTQEHIKIDTNKIKRVTDIQFSQGDEIVINTKIGERDVYLIHEGQTYNIISCIEKDSDWFTLTAGQNIFTFECSHGENNMRMTITYRNAYGGM